MRERKRAFHATTPPEPELEERLDLESHLLEEHGTWIGAADLERLKVQHEWNHRFDRSQG
jgi:hypothetical protein